MRLGLRVAKHDDAGTMQVVYYDRGMGTGNTQAVPGFRFDPRLRCGRS